MIGLNLSLWSAALGKGGGWTPLNLGSKLGAWWDASAGLSLSGSQVTGWADRKNGYTVSQGVSASRPTWSATSFNGYPSLTFDGVDDVLSVASHPFGTGATPYEIFGVVEQSSNPGVSTAQRCFISWGGSAGFGEQIRLFRNVSSGVNRLQGNVGTGPGAGIFPSELTQDFSFRHAVQLSMTSTQSRVTIDGIASSYSAAVPNILSGALTIGANASTVPGQLWQGKVRDIIVTLPTLTADEITKLQTFVMSRRAR